MQATLRTLYRRLNTGADSATLHAKTARLLRGLYFVASGEGANMFAHKREYHRRRAAMEKQFLAEGQRASGLLRANRCPSCEGTRVRQRFANPVGFQFSICAEDGTVYMDPVPTEAALTLLYNDEAQTFNHLARRVPHATNHDDVEALLRWVPDELRGGRLLDVGCALGGFLLALSATNEFEAEGVELSEAAAARARGAGLRVRAGRLEDIAEDHQFSVITMLQVIEHIVEPRSALEQCRRLLKAGGMLYLNTPAVDSGSFRFLERRHIHVSSFGHVSLFTRRSLDALASGCGFRVLAHEYTGGRDLTLHDVITLALSRERFSHRMALYNGRLAQLGNALEETPLRKLPEWLGSGGDQSYQRAALVAV
ncbi:MAG TPA: class I SAM-dependent methyltransferase [Polyangiaceae bacterium]|nr:class I SAM-dependent methyltransferase [Polyangiaceae bacterium]